MIIRKIGGGRRLSECERILDLADGAERVFLTPIPTTKDKIYITGSSVTLRELSDMLGAGDLLAGYNLPPGLRSEAEKKGARVYDAGKDEKLLLDNAYLTAKGAAGYLITHTDRDLGDLSLGIVGYGRIGKALLSLLLFLGARPRVFTGRSEVVSELCASGVDCSLISEKERLSGLDWLINTAPARQIGEEEIPSECRILDLASGSIFKDSGRFIKLSSVPDNYFPITAGRLYAEGILRAIKEEKT